jgi:putative SOS response-associated peptidase YedK
MCNNYRNEIAAAELAQGFTEAKVPLRFPHGIPNLQPRADIRITETAPIVRISDGGEAELIQIRWSWPGPKGQPVFNFRSEGREFGTGRCLIPTDGFYEFTDPPTGASKGVKKQKWLFTKVDEPWFCIAGIWRKSDAGDAFAMLTTEPGPDIAPIHDRQVVVLGRDDWARWLDTAVPASRILKPSPAGSLRAAPVATG